MKYLLKKNRVLLSLLILPYLLIYVICLTRTEKEVILTGDVSPVSSLIEIDNNYQKNGSFNSIFVISYEKATIFQTWILNNSLVNDVMPIYSGYAHLSTAELNKMGRLQHDQAVETSLIVAFNNAKKLDSSINISYRMKGAIITYYSSSVTDLKIGDLIFKINGYDVSNDEEVFRDKFNNRQLSDVLTIRRDNEIYDVTLTEDNYKKFSFYGKYEIDFKETTPHVKINATLTQGSSGGLLQALNNFNCLLETDYSLGKKIAGTGTIDINGKVGIIGGVKQKVYTAHKNKVDVFFCPKENYEEALLTYNSLKNKERMELVMVETFNDALEYLISCLEK